MTKLIASERDSLEQAFGGNKFAQNSHAKNESDLRISSESYVEKFRSSRKHKARMVELKLFSRKWMPFSKIWPIKCSTIEMEKQREAKNQEIIAIEMPAVKECDRPAARFSC